MTDYKPLDLSDIKQKAERLCQFDGATFYDIAECGEEDEVAGLAQELAGSDIPSLLAEVVRLRREVALAHQRIGLPHYPRRHKCECPTCQAAALDNWDPSKPLDWKPEEKA